MKFSRKMILIPQDQFNKLKAKMGDSTDKHTDSSEEGGQLVDLSSPTPLESVLECSIKNDAPQDTTCFESLIFGIPKHLMPKARAIWNHLASSPNICWDHRGQVKLNGSDIPHSHIGDLIRDCLHPYKNFEPIGREPFVKMLILDNIPLGLIGNPARREEIQRGYGMSSSQNIPIQKPPSSPTSEGSRLGFPPKSLTPPPPGLVEKRKKKKTKPSVVRDRKIAWLKW